MEQVISQFFGQNIVFLLFAIFVVICILAGVRIVPQSQKFVVERLGRLRSVLGPGINFIVPFLDRVRHKVSILERQLPTMSQDAITSDNADQVQAEVVVEAANGPVTPEGHDMLHKKGITVIPDILANAGGVTVSYFEWSQNIQQFRWELERVNHELEKAMRRAYAGVASLAQGNGLDLRTAAFVLAIKRVMRAASARRAVGHHMPKSVQD